MKKGLLCAMLLCQSFWVQSQDLSALKMEIYTKIILDSLTALENRGQLGYIYDRCDPEDKPTLDTFRGDEFRIDTTETFSPETYEISIQIVKKTAADNPAIIDKYNQTLNFWKIRHELGQKAIAMSGFDRFIDWQIDSDLALKKMMGYSYLKIDSIAPIDDAQMWRNFLNLKTTPIDFSELTPILRKHNEKYIGISNSNQIHMLPCTFVANFYFSDIVFNEKLDKALVFFVMKYRQHTTLRYYKTRLLLLQKTGDEWKIAQNLTKFEQQE